MRFLRESAVERVLDGIDDAARNQQGDVRRMSALLRASRFVAPPAVGRRDRRAPGVGGEPRDARRRAGRRARTPRAAADGRARPVADRRPTCAIGGGARRASAACSTQVGRPRRVGLVVPDPVAKVSLVRFEQVPARAHDLDQLVRWQVRKAAPFPIEEAQVSYVAGRRGAADGPGIRRVAGPARRHRGIRRRSARRPARRPASSISRPSTSSTRCSRRRRGAAPADWLLVNVAPDYASIAILRGPHLIFFRSRGADSEGTLADLVHQTAMYYEDRLQGAGFGARAPAGAAGAGAAQAADVEQIRRSLEERLATPVETVDSARGGGLTDRIAAAPALLDTLAPLVGLLLRGPGGGRMIRTNLSTRPFYNERAVHSGCWCCCWSSSRRDGRSTSRASCSYSQSDTELATQAVARRSARRGAEAGGRAAAGERRSRRQIEPRRSRRGRPTT